MEYDTDLVFEDENKEKETVKEVTRPEEEEEKKKQMFFSLMNKKDFNVDELEEFL